MKEVRRPWGNFKEFVKNKKCTVKILEVKPHQAFSLQYHNHRSEMWYFFDSATAQIGNKKVKINSGSILKIPRKTNHRIIAGNKSARILEISEGNFDEKDIIRLEDMYGRK